MEVNALTRWESLNAGLSELTDRRRVKRHRDSSAHLQNELFPKKFELPYGTTVCERACVSAEPFREQGGRAAVLS